MAREARAAEEPRRALAVHEGTGTHEATCPANARSWPPRGWKQMEREAVGRSHSVSQAVVVVVGGGDRDPPVEEQPSTWAWSGQEGDPVALGTNVS